MSLRDAIAAAPNAGQPLPWLATAGQPSLADFKAAHAAGVRTVIDLRDPMEPRPFDEAAEMAALGITYINVPVTPGAPDPAALEKIQAALAAANGTPTILHCASANRVGGALLPFLILHEGMSEEQATDVAMQVGLRSAELMEWGLAYARKHAK